MSTMMLSHNWMKFKYCWLI